MSDTENMENGNGKYTTPGSKWELYAKEMVLWKYPEHEIKFQTPTIKMDNTTKEIMRPDLAVYKDKKLIAVVEVDDLWRPDKLILLKAALPNISVWWISKTDLLSLVIRAWTSYGLRNMRGKRSAPASWVSFVASARKLSSCARP